MTLETLINKSTIRVEAENHTCYWTADGYKFDNKNLALWYETDRQSYVSYVDSQIDIIRGHLQTSIDMEYDYNKQFLHYLRTSHAHLNLYFSGGADSVTILETAHLNNISFDKRMVFVECFRNKIPQYFTLFKGNPKTWLAVKA